MGKRMATDKKILEKEKVPAVETHFKMIIAQSKFIVHESDNTLIIQATGILNN